MTYWRSGRPGRFFEADMADKHTPEMTKNHRARAREKLLASGGTASPELVLEVFLFDLLPRIDTYPVAHRLLERFGSLEGVFSADADELMSVSGIGRRSAERIRATGSAVERTVLDRFTAFPLDADYKVFPVVSWLLRGADADRKLVIAADGGMKYLSCGIFESEVDRKELEKFISDAARRGAVKFIVAHRHPDDCPEPSAKDVAATAAIRDICASHGAELVGHFVVTGTGFCPVPIPGEEK